MRRALRFIPSFVAVAALAACTQPAPAPHAQAETEAEKSAPAETGEAAEGVPKIAADEPIFEFGAIKADDKVEHVFTIKNEGTADLKIDRVQRT